MLYSNKFYCLDGRVKDDDGAAGAVGTPAEGLNEEGCDGAGGVAGGV